MNPTYSFASAVQFISVNSMITTTPGSQSGNIVMHCCRKRLQKHTPKTSLIWAPFITDIWASRWTNCQDAGDLRRHETQSLMASQITGVSTVRSTTCWTYQQRKHQGSALLALWGAFTTECWILSQRANHAESVSMLWRHNSVTPSEQNFINTWSFH